MAGNVFSWLVKTRAQLIIHNIQCHSAVLALVISIAALMHLSPSIEFLFECQRELNESGFCRQGNSYCIRLRARKPRKIRDDTNIVSLKFGKLSKIM